MMDKNRQNLTNKQLKTINAILESRTIGEAAKKIGISRALFYEWMKNPEFKTELKRKQDEIIEIGLIGLRASVSEAVEVMRSLLKTENEGIRFRSAESILNHYNRHKELAEIEERLSRIEKVIEYQK